jgi:hypothetical protein
MSFVGLVDDRRVGPLRSRRTTDHAAGPHPPPCPGVLHRASAVPSSPTARAIDRALPPVYPPRRRRRPVNVRRSGGLHRPSPVLRAGHHRIICPPKEQGAQSHVISCLKPRRRPVSRGGAGAAAGPTVRQRTARVAAACGGGQGTDCAAAPGGRLLRRDRGAGEVGQEPQGGTSGNCAGSRPRRRKSRASSCSGKRADVRIRLRSVADAEHELPGCRQLGDPPPAL